MNLHDGERLLVKLHASPAMLVTGLLRALIDAAVLTVILSIATALLGFFAFDALPAWYVYLALFILAYGVMAYVRWRFWSHSDFVVTTERILLHYRRTLLNEPMHTVKWNQFQEGFVERKKPLEILLGGHGLGIRYGTADAHHVATFPSLPYANDLKHYLDKVDSAVRAGTINDVKPFVLKPRGRRDEDAQAEQPQS
jgi:hypothetical protein